MDNNGCKWKWVIVKVIIYSFLMVYHVEAQVQYFCNNEMVVVANDNTDTNRCNYVSKEPMTWNDAWSFCHKRDGWLVNCPKCTDGQGAYIGNELLAYNGISDIWTGLHIKDNRLIQDDFPTPSKKGELDVSWDKVSAYTGGTCMLEEFERLDCGGDFGPDIDEGPPPENPQRRRRKRDALPTGGIPENCEPVYRQRLVSCDEKHNFACYFSGVKGYDFMTSVIVSGRVPSQVRFNYPGITRQFYLTTEKSHNEEIDATCQKVTPSGQALRSRSPTLNHVILTALTTAVQNDRQLLGMTEDQLTRTLYWYHDSDDTCKTALLGFAYSSSRNSTGVNYVTMSWPCSASLPVLCEFTPIDEGDTPSPQLELIPNRESSITTIDTPAITIHSLTMETYQERQQRMFRCKYPEDFGEGQSFTAYVNGLPTVRQVYDAKNDRPPFLEVPPVSGEVLTPLSVMGISQCQVNNERNNKLLNSKPAFLEITDFGDVFSVHLGMSNKTEYKDIWDSFFKLSLAGDLSYDLFIFGDNAMTFKLSNVVERLREVFNGRWVSALMDFIIYPKPYLIVYVSSPGLSDVDPRAVKPGTQEMVGQVTRELQLEFRNTENVDEFNSTDMKVYSINYCWAMNISVTSIGRNYSLPDTRGGSIWQSPQTCAQDGKALVTVECAGSKRLGYDWAPAMVNPACDYSSNGTAEDSKITEELKSVSQENITKENVEEVLQKTKDITDQIPDSEIQPIDVAFIADILQKSSEVEDLTSDQAKEILDTATRLTNLGEDVLEEAQEIGQAASRVIKSLDDVGTHIQVSAETKVNRLVTENLALEVWDLSEEYDKNTIIGLKVLSDGKTEMINSGDLVSLFTPSSLEYGKADVAILLPRAFIETLVGRSPNLNIRLAMNVYADTGLYRVMPATTARNTTLNSKVIAAKVLVNGVPITDLGNYNVTTVFLPNVKVPKEDRARVSVCAYWDFTDNNGVGGWSTKGCTYSRTESGRDVCTCDHLTNFAILVSFYDQGERDKSHDVALGVISIVGLVLSIIGLSLSILSFLCIKKLRQGRPQQTLFNLSVALLLSWLVFLSGVSRTENHTGCIAVAAILHYLIMASFMWMLMEGILQYLLFVRVMNTYFTNYMKKTAVLAWGLPLVPVVIVLAIDPDLYRGGEDYCWMSVDAFYYAFAIPVGLIVLTNVIFFIMVVVSLCKRKDMSKHSSQNSSQTVVNIRASFICFFILGLSWIFGFLTIEDARAVFQYLFCIFATLQGFVIFVMMTARDKTIRQYWKNVCCRCNGDKQKQKTYRTWGDKGTGTSSNSGVQSVGGHMKDYSDTNPTMSTSGMSSTDSTADQPLALKSGGYGNEQSDLSEISFNIHDKQANM